MWDHHTGFPSASCLFWSFTIFHDSESCNVGYLWHSKESFCFHFMGGVQGKKNEELPRCGGLSILEISWPQNPWQKLKAQYTDNGSSLGSIITHTGMTQAPACNFSGIY